MDTLKDIHNLALLLLLYIVQGVPMGLSGSIPFLLQGHVSYSEQSLFSLVSLPFSLKLLWAPIVDSLYFKSIGRRKSWLVPVQLLCGGMMLWGGCESAIGGWIGTDTSPPRVGVLCIYFGVLYFLMATQDIAVDGWALTMLSPENKGLASTCNSIGQTVGFFIAHVGFLALNNATTCNRLFRSTPSDVGMVSLAEFVRFWGWVIIAITAFVWMFKREQENDTQYHGIPTIIAVAPIDSAAPSVLCDALTADVAVAGRSKGTKITPVDGTNSDVREIEVVSQEPETVMESYKLLWKLLWLRPVQLLIIILLTCRIPFAPTDSSTHLKIVEAGMSKEEVAFFAPALIPLGILCPIVIGKLITGPRPLRVFLFGMPIRMLLCVLWAGILPLTRYVYSSLPPSTSPPIWFYFLLYVVTSLYNVSTDLMSVPMMAFYARVSDPSIGGTYMTLLNTIANLGSKWPNSLSLWLLDFTNIRVCDSTSIDMGAELCPVYLDGYFVQLAVCVLLGLLWLYLFGNLVTYVEGLNESEWSVVGKKGCISSSSPACVEMLPPREKKLK